MATIYKLSEGLVDSGVEEDMEEFVENYWGNLSNEKLFTISFLKLYQLFLAGTAGEVALKVTDIDKPSWVNGEWMVFEEDMDDLLSDPEQQPGIYYFVMDEDIFTGIRNALENEYELNTIIINGRIGKLTPDGSDYVGYLVAYETSYIPPGGAGDGAATGIRIPPAA